jgi:hypothetical protein
MNLSDSAMNVISSFQNNLSIIELIIASIWEKAEFECELKLKGRKPLPILID